MIIKCEGVENYDFLNVDLNNLRRESFAKVMNWSDVPGFAYSSHFVFVLHSLFVITIIRLGFV